MKLSRYSFNDLPIDSFKYDSAKDCIEICLTDYFDRVDQVYVFRKCKLIISNWKKAESSEDGKVFDDLERYLGIFSEIQEIKENEDVLELGVILLGYRWGTYRFYSPEIDFIFEDDNVIISDRSGRYHEIYFSNYFSCNDKQNITGRFKLTISDDSHSLCRIYGREHYLGEEGFIHWKAFNEVKELEILDGKLRAVIEDYWGDSYEYFFDNYRLFTL